LILFEAPQMLCADSVLKWFSISANLGRIKSDVFRVGAVSY
jgi:hypothetical protein